MNPDNGHGAGDGQGGEDFPIVAHPQLPTKPAIHPDDAMQAWIEGLKEKIDNAGITRDEAFALAMGRMATVMMEHVHELALMAADETQTPQAMANAGLLAMTYSTLVEETLDSVRMVWARQNRIARINEGIASVIKVR